LYCGTRASPTGFTKQQQKQSQQQQQLQHQQNRLWADQLAAAQYRTLGNSTAMTQFPNWQNGRQDSPAQISFAQTIIPTSSSQEAIGPKHAQISQQQQLMTITTLPHARVRRQDHHLSSVYEETGGGFRTVGALPLQLLCNDRL
jgi:type II secretory pathway pseudopilin PulG